MDSAPKDKCFAQAEGNFFKLLYSLPLKKFSWHSKQKWNQVLQGSH